MAAQVARDPEARRPANACADRLNHYHQRIGQNQRPPKSKAELGACLTVGRDAAGVVIGRARYKAGAENRQQTRLSGLDDVTSIFPSSSHVPRLLRI